ncbi:hypothetical protein [Sorangium sp. So ce381]|uniref:hypothetical protein n=1 Tax=Sorangium sp. So ce381 TaxID=3133307 RepID=UPI003F5B8636
MKSARWLFAGLIGMMLALPACSDDTQEGSGGGPGEGGGGPGEGGGGPGEGGGGTGGFTVTGPISGETAPEDAVVAVVWVVSSSSPDYGFSFGEGTASGATFTVGFGSAPPREAINSNGVGMGFVMLLAPGTQVPEGEIDSDVLDTALLGASSRHVIVWHETSGQGFGWSKSFPAGFGCGKCVAAPEGEGFDSYEPVDCSEVEVQVASDPDSLEFCNWT